MVFSMRNVCQVLCTIIELASGPFEVSQATRFSDISGPTGCGENGERRRDCSRYCNQHVQNFLLHSDWTVDNGLQSVCLTSIITSWQVMLSICNWIHRTRDTNIASVSGRFRVFVSSNGRYHVWKQSRKLWWKLSYWVKVLWLCYRPVLERALFIKALFS